MGGSVFGKKRERHKGSKNDKVREEWGDVRLQGLICVPRHGTTQPGNHHRSDSARKLKDTGGGTVPMRNSPSPQSSDPLDPEVTGCFFSPRSLEVSHRRPLEVPPKPQAACEYQ